MNIFKFIKNRIKYRDHFRLYKKHKKENIKAAKEFCDSDYGYLHDFVRLQLQHMLEFYSDARNCMQVDESRLQIVEELKQVLSMFDELDHVYDGEGIDVKFIPIDDCQCKMEFEHKSKSTEDLFEKEHRLYREIYAYIGEHIEAWWD